MRPWLIFTLVLVSAILLAGCQRPARVATSDLDRLIGKPWVGTLTYRDYTTDRPTSIPSTLQVAQRPTASEQVGTRVWEVRIGYPDEPHADSARDFVLAADGASLNDERVIDRELLPDGTVRFITEALGSDNDQPVTLRRDYLIGPRRSTIIKQVRPSGSAEFVERNRYEWSR